MNKELMSLFNKMDQVQARLARELEEYFLDVERRIDSLSDKHSIDGKRILRELRQSEKELLDLTVGDLEDLKTLNRVRYLIKKITG